jgi:hypothetical protein
VRPSNEEGTPLPLDEPQSDNAPAGLYVDYYLPDVPRTPVVVEVLASDGSVARRWSSASPSKPVDPKSVDFTTHWIPEEPVPAATAGAHRFVWDFHETSGDGPLVPPGTYTVALSVNGTRYTRGATVLRDPRIAATDADLRAQYDFARRIEATRAGVRAAHERAEKLVAKLSAAQASVVRSQIAGEAPAENPDDSMGAYSHDLSSLRYLGNALDYLESAVESADAAPTPDMRAAYVKLVVVYRATLALLDAMER